MNPNETDDFCVLYVESTDERATLVQTLLAQNKPAVILLAEDAQVFQQGEDFIALKHVQRQLGKLILFVIPAEEPLQQIVKDHGFPVYSSMDALTEALTACAQAQREMLRRTTSPLNTAPLSHASLDLLERHAPFSAQEPDLSSLEQNEAPSSQEDVPLPPLYRDLPHTDLPHITPPPQAAATGRKVHRGAALASLFSILLLLGVGLLYTLLLFQHMPSNAAPASSVALGHITFMSSEQLSENTSQGINDKMLIDLHGLPNPAPQKRYYAWLLSDKSTSDTKALPLGALSVSQGFARLLYPGDAQHTNLLVNMSRFLVTEEDARVTPMAPSPDDRTWRYYGEFSQQPLPAADAAQRFSYLDHLRHLLAADPTLDEMELPGGLNNWFYRNTGKILEWASSMREQWEDTNDVELLRRQTTRTLAYLDGLSYVRQDIPPGSPMYVNERLARVGLIEVGGPTQDPPSYMTHIVHHINGLLQSGQATPELRHRAADLVTALNTVRLCLTQVRSDAQQILKKSDAELRTSATLTLINDMIDNATHAYVGQNDSATGQTGHGVVWVHDQMQALATFTVSIYTPGKNSSIQMIQNQRNM